MYVILVYDISQDDNGAKVWRKVFGICKRYLIHVQKSVFEGDITEANLKKLEYEIDFVIRDTKDSVIIFKNRNERWLNKKILGVNDELTSSFI